MKRSAVSFLCLVFFLMIALTSAARAEIREGAFYVTPRIGGYLFDGRQDLENAFDFGLGLGYYLTPHWGVQGLGDILSMSTEDGDNAHGYLYRLEVLYHILPASKLVPYLAIGLGGITIDPPKGGADSHFLVNYGVGLKYFFQENWAVQADVRHVISFNETRDNLAYSIGLTYQFGGVKPAVPAPVAKYEPKPERKPAPIVIVASEPKAEEKVVAVVSAPKVEVPVVVLAFEDVHFDFDKSTLTKEAQAILKRSIQLLKANPKARVIIAGYTSASGTKDYNQKLSERRSKAVYDYLTQEGLIPPERLDTIGYGEMRPAMYEPIPEEIYSSAAKANMRVLFEIRVK